MRPLPDGLGSGQVLVDRDPDTRSASGQKSRLLQAGLQVSGRLAEKLERAFDRKGFRPPMRARPRLPQGIP